MGRLGEQRPTCVFNHCEHFAIWVQQTGHHRSTPRWRTAAQTAASAPRPSPVRPSALLGPFRLLLAPGRSSSIYGRDLALKSLEQLDGCASACSSGLSRKTAGAGGAVVVEQKKAPTSFGRLQLVRAQNLAEPLARWRSWKELQKPDRKRGHPARDPPPQ